MACSEAISRYTVRFVTSSISASAAAVSGFLAERRSWIISNSREVRRIGVSLDPCILLTGCCQQGSTISIPGARQRAAQPGKTNHDRRTRLLHPPDVARADRALDAGGGGPALSDRDPGLRHEARASEQYGVLS